MSFEPIPSKPEWSTLQQSIIEYWKQNNLFEKSVNERGENKPYRFYDGPPFITGTPHYGSLLSSIIKDVIPRYQTMKGKRVERVWGWDCHGLPIEQKVQAKLGLESNKDIEAAGIGTFIDECYAYTSHTSAEWGWYIDQIGRWVDFENAYKTMDQNYMESVLWVFKQLYDKGMVYEGKRVSWYSWKLSTPISNFEIAMDDSYIEVQDTAVTVKFRVTSGKFQDVNLLAWTTTPWTVPAHMAIAVHEDIDYLLVSSGDDRYILAKNRLETVFKGVGDFEIIEEFKGKELVGLSYTPPFNYYVGKVDPEKNHRVYHADFVTDDSGTGIAHEAPEFGDVDFELAQANGIHITEAVDNAGRYTSQIPDYEGTLFLDAIEPITTRLKEEGHLFKKESITHRVPECPRSKTLLMQKAQKSWFIDIQSLKPKLFEKNEQINWFPGHVKHGRFYKSIETAPDWCISRSRYWGTPMPVWRRGDVTRVLGSLEDIYQANKSFGQITKIILVRHGESEANVLNVKDSHGKYGLTDKGREEAKQLAGVLSQESIDVVYCSPLERTRDTIHPSINQDGLTYFIDEDIREMNHGSYDLTGHKEFHEEEARFFSDPKYKFGGGESKHDVQERMVKFYQRILREHGGKTVAIVSHGGPLSNLLHYITGNDCDSTSSKHFPRYAKPQILYVHTTTGKQMNLHRPFIDDVYVPDTKSFTSKKVLGVHGWTSRGLQGGHDSKWLPIQEKLAESGIQMDVPDFDKNKETSYAKWRETLETLDVASYDTILATSFGCPVIMQYLCEKDVHVKRLVLVAPSGLAGNEYLEKVIPEMTQDVSKLKSLVDEIIITHSRDDDSTSAPFTYGQELATKLSADFVPVDGMKHSFGGWGRDFLAGLVRYGAPLSRIPEVFDCWVESGSMPWAQDHYPFENKSKMEASFPADFIAEYTGQIRAWFYVMHVLAVALEDNPSFKNVVVTGVINGTDGRKMSKSYGNYPDPKQTILQYGSDAIRFYLMNSPVMRGEDMNFSEEGIQETLKKVILPLWNAYSFFSTYANIDGWTDDQGELWFVRHGETKNNAEKRLNGGDNDLPLNETGIGQAHDLNAFLKHHGHEFDVVYCSTRTRAKQTAQIGLEGVYDGEIHYSDDLVEQFYGELDGKTFEEVKQANGFQSDDELRDHYRNNTKEKFEDFKVRIYRKVDEIQQKHPGKKVLIVAHGGVARALKERSFDLTSDDVWKSPSIPNALCVRYPWTPKSHELDTWILSQLNHLTVQVTEHLENYDLQRACDPFVKFLDNLNNWYIRRNRRRFWKGEMDDDKKAGYETLYEVLTTLCKLLAPVCPFITEYLYSRLTGEESVHLTGYPQVYKTFTFPSIDSKVSAVQKVVSLGLAYRSKQSLRVRQPLPTVYVVDDLDLDQMSVIAEELNVKEVKRLENIDMYATVTYAPDARKIGQSDRKMYMKDILAKAKSGEAYLEGEELVVEINGEQVRLSADEFEVRYIPKEGTDIKFEAGFGTVVGVDDRLTDELIAEGYARDLIRSIQDTRKEAGFEITDRIVFDVVGDASLRDVVQAFAPMIEAEVLGTYDATLGTADRSTLIEIGDMKAELLLLKKC